MKASLSIQEKNGTKPPLQDGKKMNLLIVHLHTTRIQGWRKKPEHKGLKYVPS